MKGLRVAGFIAGFFFILGTYAHAQSANTEPVVRETLANGMRVVILPSRLAPVGMTVLTYGVGSNDDTMPGIAHATEHMMFRGTNDISANQLAIIAARAGAEYNANTQELMTEYWFKLPAAYVPLALRLEADRMHNAKIAPSDWKTERPAIEQEVRAHESVPGASLQPKLMHAVFGDTPYANDTVGTVASFEKMSAADIAAFYHKWYQPSNATLVVAGNVDPKAVLAEIHHEFDAIPSAPLAPRANIRLPELKTQTIRDSISELPVPIGALQYRFAALKSPDLPAAQVAVESLHSSNSAFAQLQAGGSVLYQFVFAGSDPTVGSLTIAALGLPGDSPDHVTSLLRGALDTYRKNGVPQTLVDDAKLRLLAAADYEEDSISGMAQAWASSLALNDSPPAAFFDNVDKVTAADVDRMLNKYVDPQHELAVELTPKNVLSVPHTGNPSVAENAAVPPERDEALPAWAKAYFRAGLSVPPSDKEIHLYHLHNGLTLVVRPEHTSPTVALYGEIRTAPNLYEPRGKDGVSNIADSLLSYGTTTLDRTAFQAGYEGIAARSDLGHRFSLSVQAKNFDRGVSLLADAEMHPAYPQAAFQTLRSNMEKTLAAAESLPRTQVALAQMRALYPKGDPRRRRATAATVANITLADVRNWHAFAFRPDETTIAIVGDVTPEQARATIDKAFGAWKANVKQPPSFKYPAIKADKSAKDVRITSSTSTHSEVTLTQTIDVHAGDPAAIALALADTMLSGEGIGSILFRDLRTDHGYVYSADSSVDIGRTDSTFSISFAADQKNVARAQAAALAEVRRLQQHPVAVEELQRAKAVLLAREVLPLDSYNGIASDILGKAETGYTKLDNDIYWALLLQTTPAQVQSAMRRYVNTGKFSRVLLAPG